MYLHPCGRQILLLHSYRDGLGKVRQRRLAGFSDLAQLEQQWERLCQQFPEERSRLRRLRERAVEMLEVLPAKSGLSERGLNREGEARRYARALLRLLEEGPVEVPELATLRARLEAPSGTAEPLEELAERQFQQGRHSECAEILTSASPKDPQTMARRAALWAELGWAEEGLRLLERLPLADGWAQVNRGALLWRLQRFDEALVCVLKGLALEPEVLPDLEQLRRGRSAGGYWKHFAFLWDEAGRDFLLRLWGQTLVRVRTSQARAGARFRSLVKARSRGWLLERALAPV